MRIRPRSERWSRTTKNQHRPRSRRLLLAGLFALLLPVAAQVVPSEPSQDDRAPLRIEVEELLIPVIVRDGHAKEVRDLTQADFRYSTTASCKPSPGSRSCVSRAENPPSRKAAKLPITPFLLRRPSSRRNDRSSFFLTTGTSALRALLKFKMPLSQMLDRSLGPSDRAVVLSFFGTNSGFTNDHAVLAATIRKIKTHPALR